MLKKSFNFAAVVLAAVTVIGLSSCKDEVRYSCDPTIDAVIRQNLPKYEGMTREEWKNLPDSLKDAAYVAMKPEVKKDFWFGKLNEIKEAKFFNDSEKEHISKLYEYVLSIDDFFTDKFSEDKERNQKVQNYYKEWAFYGLDYFDWRVIDVILIAEDKEELDEDYIEHVKQNAASNNTTLTHANGGSGGTNCNCNTDVYCNRRFGLSSLCESSCDNKVKNCGIFSSSECKRKCYEPGFGSSGNGSSGGTVYQIDERIKALLQMSERELLDEMFKE